jgi:hypothetical protein
MCNRRAISDLLIPARCNFRISAACKAAVFGRPNILPFFLAWARPARVRSRRISLSNSAKIANRPAIARPAGVVRSSASVSDTKPTPRCCSSCRVTSRSVTERPQRSRRQTSTTSISRRRAASSSCSRLVAALRPSQPHGSAQRSSSRAVRHTRAWLGSASRESAGHSSKRGRKGPHETVLLISVTGQKRYLIPLCEGPVLWAFQKVRFTRPKRILFGQIKHGPQRSRKVAQ